MEKATYHISKFNNSDVEAAKVEGYIVELLVNGVIYRFGVHKDPDSHPANLWTVTEIGTGYTTAPTKYKTRKEAIEYINSEKHIELFGNYVKSKGNYYTAQCRMLAHLIETGKPITAKKHKKQLDEWEKELFAAQLAEKEAEQPKPEPSAIKPKAPKRRSPKPKQPQTPKVEHVALVATMDALKEWAADKSGVRIEQARETSPLWVCGKLTKALTAELKEAGFKSGTSKKFGKGYWANPTA